jgi:small nuclear ribonucleoprotein (snRNP)-like protein
MFRRILIAIVLTASTAGMVSAQTRVTLLMKNGERLVGDLTYKGGAEYTLNGRDIPSNDVAVVSFVQNDPSPQEVNRVPTVDFNPVELERHVFAMRDGTLVWGKLYKFSPDGNIITFDQREGGRHDVAASNIQRIYINPASARRIYAPILAGQSGGAVGTTGANSATVRVPANQQWVPTGFNVRRGETIRFNASGEVMWSPDAADRATPRGAPTGRKSDRPPVAAAPGGALIGRVGNGRPFLIGSQGSVRMPENGQLFLGINDDIVNDNTGDFDVSINR